MFVDIRVSITGYGGHFNLNFVIIIEVLGNVHGIMFGVFAAALGDVGDILDTDTVTLVVQYLVENCENWTIFCG